MQILNEKVTNAILIKCAKRFKASSYVDQFEIDELYKDTEFTFKGIFRSNQHFILEGNGSYFIEEFSYSPSKSNETIKMVREPKKFKEITLVKVSDLQYDPSIFIPMKTGDAVDYIFSSDGGIFPATNYMIIGDPGIGKSTQTLDILVKIKKNDPTKKVLFVSGEMNDIDMYGYVQRYPDFGTIPTLFLCDYLDDNPADIIERTYAQGWDLILTDSFVEIQESVQSSSSMNRTQAEKWMIDMMVKNNKGNNEGNHYTSFLAIQQVTKGGGFVGSNKLKHNTTGMIELRYSTEFSGDRYAKVTKNRRGFKYDKIYFSLDKPNSVEYDVKRLERDEEIKKRLQREKEIIIAEEDKFNEIFNINPTKTDDEIEFDEITDLEGSELRGLKYND